MPEVESADAAGEVLLALRLVRAHVHGDVGDLGLADLALVVLLARVLPAVVTQELAQVGEGQAAVGADEGAPARGRMAQPVDKGIHYLANPDP